MLKELWKKLGSELAPSAWPEEQYQGRLQGDQGEFRVLPHMTHTGEFHLESLTAILEQRYGKTFQNQGDESIRDMIHFASRIQDQDVQRELLLFYLNCSPVVQEYLRSDEVMAENHFLSRSPDHK